MTQPKRIRVRIQRYLPGQDPAPYYQEYTVEIQEPHSVLNVLDLVFQQDPTLSYLASCRRGFCALCTARVNGRVVKTCLELVEGDLVLEPAGKLDRVIKDLAIRW